jgi:hypothetical protein
VCSGYLLAGDFTHGFALAERPAPPAHLQPIGRSDGGGEGSRKPSAGPAGRVLELAVARWHAWEEVVGGVVGVWAAARKGRV